MMNWSDEMSQMLVAFECQAKYSLSNIKTAFKREGLSFSAEFRQYFLRVTTNRLKETYDHFEIKSMLEDQANVGLYGSMSAIDTFPMMSPMYTKNQEFHGIREATSDSVEVIDSSDEEDQPENRFKMESLGMTSAIQYDDHEISPELHDDDEFDEDGSYTDQMSYWDNLSYQKDDLLTKGGDLFEVETRDMDTASEDTSTEMLDNETNILRSTKSKNIAARSTKSGLEDAKNPVQMKKRFKCRVCEYSSNQKGHLNIHMRTHTGEKPYQCDICQKGFIQLRDMKRHKVTHTNQIPFHCRGCFTGFSQEADQKNHEKVCKYRRYECHICKKYVTAGKYDFKKHMRKHSGEKPYRCEICMKRLTRKACLKKHLNTIHIHRNIY